MGEIIELRLPDWGNPHDEEPRPEQVLTDGWSPVPGLTWEGALRARAVRVLGHIGFQIEGKAGRNDKFLLAVVVKINGREAYRGSTNVRRDQHYVNWPLAAVSTREVEVRKVEVLARAHLKSGNPGSRICYKEPHYTSVWIETG